MMNKSGSRFGILVLALMMGAAALLVMPRQAMAQNPVQWSSNPKQAVERSAELALPLLIWVKDGRGDDVNGDDDLEDAQEDCFRDPVVVGIIQKHFVALRVSRNSRSLEEMHRLGLPTGFGLYCAVLTSELKLIDTMGPGDVAQPAVFEHKLIAAYAKYCDDVYENQLRPVLEDMKSPKDKARRAAQVVWRLGIKKADKAVIGLLSREDLSVSEKGRVYGLLASLGTQTSIGFLLDRVDDKAATNALMKAEPGALEWLVPAMPVSEGEVSAKQLAAYTAVARICRTTAMGKAWWDGAKPAEREKEIERVKGRAETVMGVWREREGA